MAELIDVSLPLSSRMISWPSDPPFEMTPFKTIEEGDGSNVSVITMGSHAGTHVDPPRHFMEDGEAVDSLDLDKLIGPCSVVEDLEDPVLDREVVSLLLDELPIVPERLLFKTRASDLWDSGQFSEEYVWLDESGALTLVRKGLKLVGVDYLSVGPPDGGGEVHRLLLQAGIVVVEGLDLRSVDPGDYELICLPLRIQEGNGAPARVILKR